MAQQPSGHFDIGALHAAIDAKRQASSLSWQDVAREVSASGGHARARVVSASTIRALSDRATLEGDGVLQILLWLDRTPESFVAGALGEGKLSAQLPPNDPGTILRFDAKAIHCALDAKRLERGMTWQALAREIGVCTASNLTRLADGGRVAFPQVMRVIAWLDRPASSFTRARPR